MTSSPAPGHAGRPGPVVLIVDDDPGVRRHVRVSLEAEGYTVREAGDAEEGLALVDEERPDLILLDVLMPQVDGWEMLRQVQERYGVGAIPVVMFSGRTEEGAERGGGARSPGLRRQAVRRRAARCVDEGALPV